jgi:DNA-directed RNA polymerase subunit M/transcription elongation factor TFIIS
MEECPDCKNYLIPRRRNNLVTLTCVKCGFKTTYDEFVAKYKKKQQKNLPVILPSPRPSPWANVDPRNDVLTVGQQKTDTLEGSVVRKCPFCGYDKADLIYNAVTRGDEDMLELYKCAGCGKVSREGWGFA